jgi:RHS repeat-associated protein
MKNLFPPRRIILIALFLLVLGFTPQDYAAEAIGKPDSALRAPPAAEQQITNLFKSAQEDWKHQHWKKALTQYRQIANSSPEFASKAHLEIGKFYKYQGRWDAALAEYESAISKAVNIRDKEDAQTAIAAVHLSKGDNETALAHFRQILTNTADWQQVKYCTYWIKELKRRISYPKEGECNICGPNALKELFKLLGVNLAPEAADQLGTSDPEGASMDEIRQKATAIGLPLYGVKLSLTQLKDIQKPVIVLTESPKHYLLVTGFDTEGIQVIDPANRGAHYVMPDEEFLKFWNGYVLALAKPSPQSAFTPLSDDQMKSLKGKVCYCCPDAGNGNQNSNQDGDPIPSCVNPVLFVNTISLNLMAQETDLSYKGRGPRVEITRFYNADDFRDGPFGRGWTFNYNVVLTANPGGTVDIRRETGSIHRFTSSGGGNYLSPVGIYDTLLQNGDGTFSLKIKSDKTIQNFTAMGVLTNITDHNGNTVTFQYDAGGKLVSIADAVGRITTLNYNANGKITSIQDPLGRTVNYTYDGNNNLIETVDMAGRTVDYGYDNPSCPGGTCAYLTSVTTSKGTTSIVYTISGEGFSLRSITDPLGNKKSYGGENPITITEPNGNWIAYSSTYPSYTSRTTNSAGQSVSYTYSSGNRTGITDGRGNTTALQYDSQGNITRISDALGNAVQLFYDSHNNPTNAVDPLGRATRYQYDAKDNLTKITDAKNGTVTFGYDGFGQLTLLADARSKTNSFAYDSAGNLIRTTNPVSGVTTYGYDVAGRLISMTDPKTNAFTYAYDGLDRPTEIRQAGAALVRYAYDCCNLSSVSNSAGVLQFQYDAANRLTAFINNFGQTIQYGYDANGNVTALTYPGGKVVQYQYDAGDRLSRVTDWLGNITSYSYDKAGNLARAVNANGTMAAYEYDAANRLVGLVNLKDDTSIISRYKYTLDGLGNRVNIAAFDPAPVVLASTNVSYTYDADNRIQAATGATFTHDANGNLTAIGGTKPTTFSYDIFNRLTQVAFINYAAQYQYDALGNRIARTVNGATTKYIVDPNGMLSKLLTETDGAGNTAAYYVYGLGLISKVMPTGQTYFYHYDGLGSTTALSDSAGNVVNKYAYDPFGNLSSGGAETVPNPLRYVGGFGVMDETNGLLFMRARYYSPTMGRFITKDPAGLRADLNLYGYVRNKPITKVDPTGLGFGSAGMCGFNEDHHLDKEALAEVLDALLHIIDSFIMIFEGTFPPVLFIDPTQSPGIA